MTLITTDPRTGTTGDTGIPPTSQEEVAGACAAAAAAAGPLAAKPRTWRAGLLRTLARALEADRASLVAAAAGETGLSEARLGGELSRTTFQLELFADAVDEGGYLEAAIDHAGPTPLGAAPDVRRMLVPIGPVAVFGSSNFPFAFSVPGGDTASALAAGNPVVLKAHSSHPLTSRRAFETMRRAAESFGAPSGTIGIVYGQDAGAALVADPRISAVGFTGSLRTGRILLEIIERRPVPVPFYGELSSLNPLIVTPGAADARGAQIAEGLAASVTGSAGQLCTKPGIAFVPPRSEALVEALAARVAAVPEQPLLNAGIHAAFMRIQEELLGAGARPVVRARPGVTGLTATGAVLQVPVSSFSSALAEEAFGPLVVVVRYDSLDDVVTALSAVPDSLTATLHSEADELEGLRGLVGELSHRVGRLVFDGYPTGVRVSWAQHHGGPWPATNTAHTSVGVTAMRRFLRPLAWQDAPAALLPEELRDECTSVPRRVDGVLRLASPQG